MLSNQFRVGEAVPGNLLPHEIFKDLVTIIRSSWKNGL